MMLMLERLYNRRGVAMWYVAPSHRQCHEAFDNKLMPLITTPRGGMRPGVSRILRSNPRTIVMWNGNYCQFHTLENYEKLRSATLTDLIDDEAAFARDQAYERALAPMLIRRGQRVIFSSTPAGFNHFHKYYQRGLDTELPTWGALSATYEEVGDSALVAAIDEMRSYTAPDTFRQEYLAEFVEGGGAVFRNTLRLFTLTEPAAPTTRNFVGIDLGFTHDRTVVTIINSRGELVFFKRFELHEQADSGDLKAALAGILTAFPGVEGYVEVNFNPMMREEIYNATGRRVALAGWFTTSQNKTPLINRLVHAVDTGDLKLMTQVVHPDMTQVKRELEDFRSDFTEVRRLTSFGAPPGGYDDCVMSIALAVEARHMLS